MNLVGRSGRRHRRHMSCRELDALRDKIRSHPIEGGGKSRCTPTSQLGASDCRRVSLLLWCAAVGSTHRASRRNVNRKTRTPQPNPCFCGFGRMSPESQQRCSRERTIPALSSFRLCVATAILAECSCVACQACCYTLPCCPEAYFKKPLW